MEHISTSPEETQNIATTFASTLTGGEVLALEGELGAGKTTFMKGLVSALGSDIEAMSPTYTLINEYPLTHENIRQVVHMDYYRLADVSDLHHLAIDEYLRSDTVVAIEWPDILTGTIEPTYAIRFTYVSPQVRKIEIIKQEKE